MWHLLFSVALFSDRTTIVTVSRCLTNYTADPFYIRKKKKKNPRRIFRKGNLSFSCSFCNNRSLNVSKEKRVESYSGYLCIQRSPWVNTALWLHLNCEMHSHGVTWLLGYFLINYIFYVNSERNRDSSQPKGPHTSVQ